MVFGITGTDQFAEKPSRLAHFQDSRMLNGTDAAESEKSYRFLPKVEAFQYFQLYPF
jgi:hypothetical protein